MSIQFKDVSSEYILSTSVFDTIHDDGGIDGYGIVVNVQLRENDGHGQCILADFSIDTAIQFRKELQRQIMKAKALEKENK